MPTTVQNLIDEVSRLLRDVEKRQWDQDFLVSAMNSAFVELSSRKPESYTVYRTLNLVDGDEQEIDDDLHRIVEIHNNVNPIDNSNMKGITKVDKGLLDRFSPNWRQDDRESIIRHYMRNEITQSKFHVWPPALGAIDPPVVPVGFEVIAAANNGFIPEEDLLGQPNEQELRDYNTAYLAWTKNPGARIRGEFTTVPKVYNKTTTTGDAPTDPGAEANDQYEILHGYYDVDSFGRNVIKCEFPLGDTRAQQAFTSVFALGELFFLVMQNDPSNWTGTNTLAASPDEIFPAGHFPTTYNIGTNGWSPEGSVSGVYYNDSDPLWQAGKTFLCQLPTNYATIDQIWIVDEDATIVSQEEIDAYQIALAEYNAGLLIDAEYVNLDEPIPYKNKWVNAIREYMLYYAWSVDDDMTANSGRAQQRFQNFHQLINDDDVGDVGVHTTQEGNE